MAWPPEGRSKCRDNLISPDDTEVGTSFHQGPCHVHYRAVTSVRDLGRELRTNCPHRVGHIVQFSKPHRNGPQEMGLVGLVRHFF